MKEKRRSFFDPQIKEQQKKTRASGWYSSLWPLTLNYFRPSASWCRNVTRRTRLNNMSSDASFVLSEMLKGGNHSLVVSLRRQGAGQRWRRSGGDRKPLIYTYFKPGVAFAQGWRHGKWGFWIIIRYIYFISFNFSFSVTDSFFFLNLVYLSYFFSGLGVRIMWENLTPLPFLNFKIRRLMFWFCCID